MIALLSGSARFGLIAAALVCAFDLSILSRTSRAAEDEQKVLWRSSLAEAQAEAKSSDRLLWIQFSGPWCINCRRMDRSTFIHPRLIRRSREEYVAVKLRSDEHENLALSLGLTTLPATVIVRPDGNVVEKMEGYADAEEFDQFLAKMLIQEGRSKPSATETGLTKRRVDAAIALAGYDPVSLLNDQRLIPGDPNLTVEHNGRVFRFATELDKVAFQKRPESYAPMNSGRCPVSQVDRGDFQEGDPRWGVVYNGHLFLFKDLIDRDRFAKDPERYARVDAVTKNHCPHCQDRSFAHRLSTRFSAAFATTSTMPTHAFDRLASLPLLEGVIRR